jgi:HAD superfamily hydrolase (TIGR01509 family)
VLYRRHGSEFTLEHKHELLGTSGPRARRLFERHLGMPGRGAELSAELLELVFAEIGRAAPPQPGARELVAALRGAGVALGVASNSPGELVALALRVAGLDTMFDSVIAADAVAHPKPAPDVYLASCRALGADPARSVALEDSQTGVGAALAAGMFVVGVPSLEGVGLAEAHLRAPSLGAQEVWGAVGLRLAA